MSPSLLHERLKDAFSPYVRTSREIAEIQHQIAHHVDSLAADADKFDSTVPAHVQGLRRQYLLALRANRAARDRLTQLQNPRSEEHEQVNPCMTTDVLTSHLEVLHLRKRFQHLQTLEHYSQQDDQLLEAERAYSFHDAQEQTSLKLPFADDKPIENLLEKAQQLVTKLEASVVLAHREMLRERDALAKMRLNTRDGAKPESRPPDHDAAHKLRALTATKHELTSWIEDSLAQCDVDGHLDTNPDHKLSDPDPRPLEQQEAHVEAQYHRYLRARTRAVAAAQALLQLVPLAHTPTGSKLQLPPATSTSGSTAKAGDTHVLPLLEANALPILDQRAITNDRHARLTDVVLRQTSELAEELTKMSHESHLLPEFPILARNKNKHAKGSSDRSATNTHGTLPELEDRVSELLGSWQFAAEAATVASVAAVERDVEQANRHVTKINSTIQRKMAKDEAWRSFADE